MPDPNIGQLVASSWEAKVTPDPVDNIFLSQWLVNRMTAGGGIVKQDGGRLIELTLTYAENTTFASYSDLDVISTTRIDVFDAARFDWRQVAGTVVVSGLERFRNSGQGEKFDLVAAKIDQGILSCKAEINRQMYSDGTGNGSKDIGGLKLLVPTDPTTGTVGGISRATFSFWRSQQASGAKTTNAFDNYRATLRTIYNKSSKGAFAEHPDFEVTGRANFEGYEGLLTANERITDKAVGDVGFKNEVLKHKGALLAFDEDIAPSDSHYLLNSKFLKFYVAKGVFLKLGEEVEPANQDAYVRKVLSYCQLALSESRRCGVVTAIT